MALLEASPPHKKGIGKALFRPFYSNVPSKLSEIVGNAKSFYGRKQTLTVDVPVHAWELDVMAIAEVTFLAFLWRWQRFIITDGLLLLEHACPLALARRLRTRWACGSTDASRGSRSSSPKQRKDQSTFWEDPCLVSLSQVTKEENQGASHATRCYNASRNDGLPGRQDESPVFHT